MLLPTETREVSVIELWLTGIVVSVLLYDLIAAVIDPDGDRLPSIGF
jgi:hypothetical protein